MNIKFKKFSLNQTDVQQMREYGILPDKKTLQNLIKAHHSNNPEPDEIAQLQDNLGCRFDEDYIQFLLKHNGGIPSKVRIKGNKIVIDHFLSFKSDFKQYGLPIANTPSGDSIILSLDGKIRFFNHNIDSIDEEVGIVADNFLELLRKLY